MTNLSKKLIYFLGEYGKDHLVDVTPVAKSMGSLRVGDLVAFTYRPDNRNKYTLGQRLALVVRPVIRDAKTGNVLLTVVKVPFSGGFTPEKLDELYKDRDSLPDGSYRTYIMSNILGHIYKIT